MKKLTFPLLISLCSAALMAAPQVKVTQSQAGGIYKKGEKITITAEVVDEGKAVSGRTVSYLLEADGMPAKRGQFVSDAAKPFTWETSLDFPGALRTEFTLLDEKGQKIPLPSKECVDQYRYVSGLLGAAVEPEAIKLPFEKPADYDAFWTAQRAKLTAEPMKLLEKTPAGVIYGVALFDVKVSCPGGKVVSGYLGIPVKAAAKGHPALVCYQGAGVVGAARHQVITYGRCGYIALCINALGILNGQKPEYYRELNQGEFKAYYYKLYPNREENFLTGLALRVLRSLEFIKSQPEWNGRDLAVMGASQGGWQALCAAAGDEQVTFCFAGVPAFGDFYSPFFGTPKRMRNDNNLGGTLNRSRMAPEEIKKYLLTNQAYFEPAFLAEQIKCKTVFSVGFVDISCPTTSVYAAFNAVPAKDKKIIALPAMTHGNAGRTPAEVDAYLRSLAPGNK